MQGWEHEKRRREQEAKNRASSTGRSLEYSCNWQEWTPEEAARYFSELGPPVFAHRTFSQDGSKKIYRNLATGWKIMVDVHGRYFTILRPVLRKESNDKTATGQTEEWYVARDRSVSPTGIGPPSDPGKYHFRIRQPNKAPRP